MDKLHNKQCGVQNVQSEQNGSRLSKDTLRALDELGDILRKVHRRMTSEGYEIVDGSIQKM